MRAWRGGEKDRRKGVQGWMKERTPRGVSLHPLANAPVMRLSDLGSRTEAGRGRFDIRKELGLGDGVPTVYARVHTHVTYYLMTTQDEYEDTLSCCHP